VKICIVWPTVGDVDFDPHYADKLWTALPRLAGLRVTLNPLSPGRNSAIVRYLRDRHADCVPILEPDTYDPAAVDLALCGRWAHAVPALLDGVDVPCTELGNEPMTTNGHPRWPAVRYAAFANTMLRGIAEGGGGGLRTALACDALRPNGWAHPSWTRWWGEVVDHVVYPWDVAAIHPYRVGSPHETRTDWPAWAHRNPRIAEYVGYQPGPRSREIARWQQLAAGKPLVVTEVGWPRAAGTDEELESWAYAECELARRAQIQLLCFYVHHHDPARPASENFSVLEQDGSLAPVGRGIKHWLDDPRETT
jgi:hypothetical protein